MKKKMATSAFACGCNQTKSKTNTKFKHYKNEQ